MNSILHQFLTALPNLTQINTARVKISSFKNDLSKIKVSIQPVAGHTLFLTLAADGVSYFDSNDYETWRLQMKIKY